ncbi:MAG: efflux RND transporter periplasmic adaptor subunit [Planctomycetaceae bacterium]|nr:efflux RND transporter periplasmic adaptor subunit [Planctomycetaceae bacterium]
MFRNILKFVLGLVAIGACWGAWYVVYRDSVVRSAVPDASRPLETLAVEVMRAREEPLEERITLVGSLNPIAETEVRARVSGYLIEQPHEVGTRVSAGDVLIRLDARDQQEMVSRFEASLKVAQAQLRSQQAEQDQAEKNVERQRRLADEGAGTLQQLEAAQAALTIALAQVELQSARVSEAMANLEQARIALKDFELTSPISGFVSARYVQAGDLAKPDVPLLRVISLATVQTNAHVVEKDYRKIQLGQQADVTIDAYPGTIFKGIVKQIAPALDPNTRTAEIRLDVENPKYLLKPGMYARVSLRSQLSHSSLAVPLSSVLDDGERTSVMTVEGTPPVVRRHPITLGVTDGHAVEVLEGLWANAKVITLGNRIAREGQEVKVIEVDWPEQLASIDESEGIPSTSDP